MGKASADPDEIRRFAHELKKFNADLESQSKSIHHRFKKLGERWQDEEFNKFAEEFEMVLKNLARFTEASNKTAPMLLRKADRLDEYLRQR